MLLKGKYLEDFEKFRYFSFRWVEKALKLKYAKLWAILRLLNIKVEAVPPATGKKVTSFIITKKNLEKIIRFLESGKGE